MLTPARTSNKAREASERASGCVALVTHPVNVSKAHKFNVFIRLSKAVSGQLPFLG